MGKSGMLYAMLYYIFYWLFDIIKKSIAGNNLIINGLTIHICFIFEWSITFYSCFLLWKINLYQLIIIILQNVYPNGSIKFMPVVNNEKKHYKKINQMQLLKSLISGFVIPLLL